jgi:7,8-dihydropterin-6-yl-methyl-4-(beta-D-ribofuranosyl)aminobenzene 5'-phosphate synthase
MKYSISILIWLVAVSQWTPATMSAEIHKTCPPLRITVVYNNVTHTPGLTTAWGFAAVIENGADVVLFDTGGDGPTLLANMERLGIAPESISAIVLSHIHGDHTGGLDTFLTRQPNVIVYIPRSFPAAFRRSVEQRGARVEVVRGPRHLFGNLYSTGEMGEGTIEQALIVESASGLVVITGCAHPGIVNITRSASMYLGKDVYLLMGGFHLLGRQPEQIRSIVAALRQLGVRKVAPSHCTGDAAIALFRDKWAKDFIEGGCGAVIDVP